MSAPTPQHGPVPSSDRTAPVRASGAERAAVVERLRVASVEGRLTFQELTDRTAAAYAARTRGELERVTGDLPALGAPGAAPAPRQVVRRFTAIMGDCDARPAGRIDQDLEALAVLGDVVLDLRAAQVPSGEVTVSAMAVLGDVRIIVPDGVRVEMTGRAVLGDRRVLVGDQEPDRRLPVVRVRANSILGDVRIVAGDRQDARRRPVTEPRAAD